MTITVHHLENSRSQRILWLLEELGLSYQVKYYKRQRKTLLAPASLRHIHPLGKSPVIQDIDDGVERTFAETGAIIEYLVEKAGGAFGAPPAREDALLYQYYLHYAEGSLMPVLFARLVLSRVPILGNVAIRKFQPLIDVHLDFVESELSKRAWFAGDEITAADVIMSYPLEAARTRSSMSAMSHPNIYRWLDSVHSRPAHIRAAANVGKP